MKGLFNSRSLGLLIVNPGPNILEAVEDRNIATTEDLYTVSQKRVPP